MSQAPESEEAVRQALRRVLWALQQLAHASLPEITEEPVEIFGARLDAWDKLCKNALEAETFLAQKKEERTLEWLERSTREIENLAQPAVAPELAELASAVESAAKLWERLARAAARKAGEALWLERAWGLALDALDARAADLPDDGRKRILGERISELRTLRERGLKILAAGAAAGIRPLRRRRLAVLIGRRIRRLRAEFLKTENQSAALAEGRTAAAESRAADAEAGAQTLRGEISALRKKIEELEKLSVDDSGRLQAASVQAETLQEDVEGLQELLKQADEQSGAMMTRALAAEEAKTVLARELESLKERFSVVERNAESALERAAAAEEGARAAAAERANSAEADARAQENSLTALRAQLAEAGDLAQAAEKRASAAQERAADFEASTLAREEELADLRTRLADAENRAQAALSQAAAAAERLTAEKLAAEKPPAPVPDLSAPKLKELESELAAARAEIGELRRSLEIAEAELRRLAPLAGESARLKTELDRGQARLAKLTAEFETIAGTRLQ